MAQAAYPVDSMRHCTVLQAMEGDAEDKDAEESVVALANACADLDH